MINLLLLPYDADSDDPFEMPITSPLSFVAWLRHAASQCFSDVTQMELLRLARLIEEYHHDAP